MEVQAKSRWQDKKTGSLFKVIQVLGDRVEIAFEGHDDPAFEYRMSYFLDHFEPCPLPNTKVSLGGVRIDSDGRITGFGDYVPATPSKTHHDPVNHPKHYTADPSGVECIQITRHRNFNIGNAIKYLWRAGLKDGNSDVQDLKKAAWYIQDEINRIEAEREK